MWVEGLFYIFIAFVIFITFVMAGLDPAIHVFGCLNAHRRGYAGQARA
jgi:hypothetical protein